MGDQADKTGWNIGPRDWAEHFLSLLFVLVRHTTEALGALRVFSLSGDKRGVPSEYGRSLFSVPRDTLCTWLRMQRFLLER